MIVYKELKDYEVFEMVKKIMVFEKDTRGDFQKLNILLILKDISILDIRETFKFKALQSYEKRFLKA